MEPRLDLFHLYRRPFHPYSIIECLVGDDDYNGTGQSPSPHLVDTGEMPIATR